MTGSDAGVEAGVAGVAVACSGTGVGAGSRAGVGSAIEAEVGVGIVSTGADGTGLDDIAGVLGVTPVLFAGAIGEIPAAF